MEDEGGSTYYIRHTCSFEDGEVLVFSERNIFDFGRVINPEYAVAPGLDPGGIPVRDTEADTWYWKDYMEPVYRVGDREGKSELIDEDFSSWELPAPYTLRRVEFAPNPNDPVNAMLGIELGINVHHEVCDAHGNLLVGDSIRATGWSAEQALHRAHHILRVTRIHDGGWRRVRALTEHEMEAFTYIREHGYFTGHAIRMYSDADAKAEERTARQEAALERACEDGRLPGAAPADL
jgi:hypothetical protein